jgi:hypothetical protein
MNLNNTNLDSALAGLIIAKKIIAGQKRTISALRGVITKERKKNAEARELVELLEWADIHDITFEKKPCGKWSLKFWSRKLDSLYEEDILIALRKAKEIVERNSK